MTQNDTERNIPSLSTMIRAILSCPIGRESNDGYHVNSRPSGPQRLGTLPRSPLVRARAINGVKGHGTVQYG
jgi:hypothetical protein